MNNIVSFKEMSLKKKIKLADEKLKEVRTLISYGHYEMVKEARQLENEIADLESELIKLIESDFFN
tara:strand:+ start:1994 stop:2191 length:198 start_codon:yes stop_codon:yes gene_type:complete